MFSVEPPSTEPWHAAAYCVVGVDQGAEGELRLRTSTADPDPIVVASGDTHYFTQFDTVGPAATVLGAEWEIYDSVGNAGFGVRSPGQVEVVAEATSTSGGNVLRITAEALGQSGVYSVDDGRLLRPDGAEMVATGFNGGVRIGVNGFSDAGNSEDEAVAWAWERMPGDFTLLVDVFPGDTNVIASQEVFPGGTVSGGLTWSQADLSFVSLPDRAYALTGQRSAAAISAGIAAPADHWHSPIYRVCAFPRPAMPTWNGAEYMTPTRLIPQYVSRARELVDLGLIVSVQDHALTGADPVMPAAAVANPSIDPDDPAFGAVYPVPYDRWGTQPTGAQRLRDSLKFYDAMVTEFTGDENLWIGLPNEFYTGGRTTASDDVIVTMVRRIRAQGWTGIISIPTGRFAGDLAGLSRGEYDTLMTRLESHGVGGNLVWEWHNYGANYPTPGSGANEVYTYAAADAQLTACRNGVPGSGRKYAVWMAEYGQATPVGTGAAGNDAWNREAVTIMATDTYGQALAVKHAHICATWWGLGDNSFDWSYSLTYGAANKGNENGPDPNTTGANPGTYPWWDVTTTALRDEWLTPGGRAHWDLAHDVAALAPATAVHYSGGVKLKRPLTYGQYEIRVRVSDDASEVTSGVVLLWPESQQWPRDGEIDWWETFNHRATRTPVQTYVHRLNPASAAAGPPYDASDDQTIVGIEHAGVDQSAWHKIVCTWGPEELSISIDDGTAVLITDDPANIPDWDMELTLQLDAWSATPPSTPITMDVDYLLLRTAEVVQGGVSPVVPVTAHSRNVRVGFQALADGPQLVYVDGRRTSGADTGGIRLIDARCSVVSAPPAALISSTTPPAAGGGGGGGGGGGTPTPVASVRGSWHSSDQNTLHTIEAAALSPAPVIGDKILLIAAGQGPSEVASPTITMPTSLLANVPSTGFNPTMRVCAVDFTTPGQSWTVTASHNVQVAAVAFEDAASFTVSAPVSGFTPTNPAATTTPANSVGLSVLALNVGNTAPVTAPSTGHTTVIDPPAVARAIHVASLALPTAGGYDPDAATVGGGGSNATALSIVAQPTAVPTGGITEPTIPAFNDGSAITLSTLSADIAAAVAAQPEGTHFQLVDGTYTDWDDVRPKTGMHFRGPASGTAVLSGTSKAYCFRAGANGTSDDVTIGRNIRIENYGLGTTRATYGAIQASPTDTVGGSFTYGHANNWFVYDLELATNSSNGLRMSDNCTALRVYSHGHTVTGIGADRTVGGLIYEPNLVQNGLNPATGVASNGGQIKVTWHNADTGRTAVIPSAFLRPKAPLYIAGGTFTATSGMHTGTTRIGIWADLDCQQVYIDGNDVADHSNIAIHVEGCNNVEVTNNNVNGTNGYGPANGSNFVAAAITVAESTNCVVDGNLITSCEYALMNRMSSRASDWHNSNDASFVNYSWPTGARYWITAGSPTPIPGLADRSNHWTGNNRFSNNVLTNCDRVVINEGTNTGGHNTIGSTPLASIEFDGNDYSGSPGILFHDRSNTGISLAAWQALPYTRDQP